MLGLRRDDRFLLSNVVGEKKRLKSSKLKVEKRKRRGTVTQSSQR